MISFRSLTMQDIPAGLALCRAAGWNQRREDWQLFLQLNPYGTCAAIDDHDHVIGTVTTLRYSSQFSWVGMLLVDPDQRRKGLGTRLLEQSLSLLSAEKTVRLDATTAGREVYLRFDFSDEYSLTRMRCKCVLAATITSEDVRPMQQEDLKAILPWDEQVFGADRSLLLSALWLNSPTLSWVMEIDKTVVAYCMGRPGHHAIQIGPLISQKFDHAISLLGAVLNQLVGGEVIIDVPQHSQQWRSWLLSRGFKEERPFIRMYRGLPPAGGIQQEQFTILGPEFG